VTLIGETGAGRDISQPGPSVAHELEGPLEAQTHDVAMRRHADRLSEHACEVERTAPRNVGERADLDRLVEVRLDVVLTRRNTSALNVPFTRCSNLAV
jgi:hypothetical protein